MVYRYTVEDWRDSALSTTSVLVWLRERSVFKGYFIPAKSTHKGVKQRSEATTKTWAAYGNSYKRGVYVWGCTSVEFMYEDVPLVEFMYEDVPLWSLCCTSVEFMYEDVPLWSLWRMYLCGVYVWGCTSGTSVEFMYEDVPLWTWHGSKYKVHNFHQRYIPLWSLCMRMYLWCSLCSVEFMHCIYMPTRRELPQWLKSLLLCQCDVFWVLINSCVWILHKYSEPRSVSDHSSEELTLCMYQCHVGVRALCNKMRWSLEPFSLWSCCFF